MSVDVTLEARDRVSQQIDAITRSVGALNSAFEQLESASGRAGRSASASLDGIASKASAVGKGLTSVGNGLTKYITKPAIAAGAALGGIVLAKGFKRFTQIDEARAKLTALGHTAEEVDKIQKSALDAVLSTAYNLDEAMTTAAGADAAGIKGDDLTKYLSTVTDAAAIAGVSMDEMGIIFNRVAANGKVTAMEMNQLADRGVPIWQYLADETGKSIEEVRKDVSAGKVDLELFRKAIDNNIGGAAKGMGAISWSGMISNIEASLGRMGASIWGATDDVNSLSHTLLELGGRLTAEGGKLDQIEQKVARFGQTIGGAARLLTGYMQTGTIDKGAFNEVSRGAQELFSKLQPIADRIRSISDALSNISTGKKLSFAGFAVGLGPALKLAGRLSSTFGTMAPKISKIVTKMGGFKGIFKALTGPLGIGVALFAGMFANSEKFRESVGTLMQSLGTALTTVFTSLGPLLSSVFDTLSTVLGGLGNFFAPILAAAAPVLTTIANLFANIVGFITPIFDALGILVGWFGEKISGPAKVACDAIAEAFGIVKGAIDLVVGAVNALKSAWESWQPSAKTLTVHQNQKSFGSGGTPPAGGNNATGTKASPGGTTLVGERGPELVNLPKGASVHTARDTEKMLGAQSFNINMVNNVSNEGMSIDQLVSQLSQKIAETLASGAEGATA